MTRLPVGEPAQTSIQEPDGSLEALAAATNPAAVAEVAAHHPTCLAAWATLGELALHDGRPVEAYAYFRVGYHRGLDRIRRAGWRGTGQVPGPPKATAASSALSPASPRPPPPSPNTTKPPAAASSSPTSPPTPPVDGPGPGP